MYRILPILITAMILMGTLKASEIITDQTKLQEIKTKNVVLQDPIVEIKGAIDKPDSYVLKLVAGSPGSAQLLTGFLDKKTSEIYIGSGYDKDGRSITFPKDVQAIKEGVAFSYGKGNKQIYVITDPECPYCARFEKAVNGKLGDYTVHVILFPLSFHKKTPAMIEWIMQGKNDAEKKERYEAVMLKGSTIYKTLIIDGKNPFVYSASVKEYLQKSVQAAMELNMRGTPAIYNEEFQPIGQDQLLKRNQK